MVTPRSATSVKSDNPMRPGGCSWRKITSRSGPFTARHARMRRSSVRRVPEPSSGCRRHSSSKTAIGLNPGAAFSIGRTSFSQTSANGSARRRSRGVFFWAGKSGILFKPVGGGRAETGLCTGDGWRMVATQVHEKPHLLIGDMSAGQRIGPLERESRSFTSRRYRQMRPFGRSTPLLG